MTETGINLHWYRVIGVAIGLAALLLSPVVAQDVQGPPDGFRAPQDSRAPAQGPADNGIPPLAPAPRPQLQAPPTLPRPDSAQPVPVVIPAPAARSTAPPPRPQQSAPRRAAPPIGPGSSDTASTQGAVTPPMPSAGQTPPAGNAVVPPLTAQLTADDAVPVPVETAEPSAFMTQRALGIGALAAAIGALATSWWWWRRRRSAVTKAADTDDSPRAASPPAPIVPQADPPHAPDAKRVAAPPVPRPATPVRLSAPTAITTGRAKLALTLQVQSIAISNGAAQFNFAVMLSNSGDRPAEAGLVRIALQHAHANQAQLLERFFDGAGGSVLAEDVVIAAGEVGTIARSATLALDQVEPMMIGGYPSLVPVIGLDVTYHWDGEPVEGGDALFGQVAAAFVLGSETAADGRIAPVRLDHGSRQLASPAARLTEMQRVM